MSKTDRGSSDSTVKTVLGRRADPPPNLAKASWSGPSIASAFGGCLCGSDSSSKQDLQKSICKRPRLVVPARLSQTHSLSLRAICAHSPTPYSVSVTRPLRCLLAGGSSGTATSQGPERWAFGRRLSINQIPRKGQGYYPPYSSRWSASPIPHQTARVPIKRTKRIEEASKTQPA